jgi:RNA polymerase sigma factor FliA
VQQQTRRPHQKDPSDSESFPATAPARPASNDAPGRVIVRCPATSSTSPSSQEPALNSTAVTTDDTASTTASSTSAPSGRLSRPEVTELIERNLPLVQHILFQVAAHYPRHADREELAQAATLGLVEAAHRFDPDRGVPFERWVSMRVRGAIVDAARALDFAPRSLRAAARTVEDAHSQLLNKLGRTPTADEVAAEMSVPVRELFELQGRVHRALVLSLDAPCGEEDGDPLTLADGLVETVYIDPSTQLEERERAAYLRDALDLLPERLQVVVSGYFLHGRSSSELAEELGVTESRVSQMRSEGLALMRTGIAAQYSEGPVVEEPESGRAASRRAAYAAALSARSTYADRLSRRQPLIPTQMTANSTENYAAAV